MIERARLENWPGCENEQEQVALYGVWRREDISWVAF
jgi:hypothetical protein